MIMCKVDKNEVNIKKSLQSVVTFYCFQKLKMTLGSVSVNRSRMLQKHWYDRYLLFISQICMDHNMKISSLTMSHALQFTWHCAGMTILNQYILYENNCCYIWNIAEKDSLELWIVIQDVLHQGLKKIKWQKLPCPKNPLCKSEARI